MADAIHSPDPGDLALEQLLIGVIFHLEEEKRGSMEAIFKAGAGFARFGVDADMAYRDLVQDVRSKARRAGLAE
jgi:hypothetical protein